MLEAAKHSNWIRRTLAGLGHEVLVSNPRRLRLIAQSYSKNDRNDACWLAELGRANPELLSPTEPRSVQSEQHRLWLRSRESMLEARTRVKRSRQAGALLGLRPKQRDSGQNRP